MSTCDPAHPCDTCKAQQAASPLRLVPTPPITDEDDLIHITTGPFKGRVYQRVNGQLRRVRAIGRGPKPARAASASTAPERQALQRHQRQRAQGQVQPVAKGYQEA